jgi:hypothetical protein
VADKDTNGQIVETPEQATQAERSPDTFYILVVSLIALVVIGAFLLWWYGVLPGFGSEAPR